MDQITQNIMITCMQMRRTFGSLHQNGQQQPPQPYYIHTLSQYRRRSSSWVHYVNATNQTTVLGSAIGTTHFAVVFSARGVDNIRSVFLSVVQNNVLLEEELTTKTTTLCNCTSPFRCRAKPNRTFHFAAIPQPPWSSAKYAKHYTQHILVYRYPRHIVFKYSAHKAKDIIGVCAALSCLMVSLAICRNPTLLLLCCVRPSQMCVVHVVLRGRRRRSYANAGSTFGNAQSLKYRAVNGSVCGCLCLCVRRGYGVYDIEKETLLLAWLFGQLVRFTPIHNVV